MVHLILILLTIQIPESGTQVVNEIPESGWLGDEVGNTGWLGE